MSKIAGTGGVRSVAGRTGNVSLAPSDVPGVAATTDPVFNVAAQPVAASAAIELSVLLQDPSLVRPETVSMATLLSDRIVLQYTSVPTGGIVQVDPDGPGVLYNRANASIVAACEALEIATGIGGKSPIWLLTEPGSTWRIDAGVGKTLNINGASASQMVDISNGEAALVFALEGTSLVGCLIVSPLPIADTGWPNSTTNTDTNSGNVAWTWRKEIDGTYSLRATGAVSTSAVVQLTLPSPFTQEAAAVLWPSALYGYRTSGQPGAAAPPVMVGDPVTGPAKVSFAVSSGFTGGKWVIHWQHLVGAG